MISVSLSRLAGTVLATVVLIVLYFTKTGTDRHESIRIITTDASCGSAFEDRLTNETRKQVIC